MTDRRRNRAPMRRSSTPERILSAGLATATCVGVVGLLGARTIEANASSASEPSTEQVESGQVADTAAPVLAAEPTTSTGLTQADLDAYAADLAKEKERLDAYRAKLVKTAKKLKRQIASQNAAAAVPAQPSYSGSSSSGSSVILRLVRFIRFEAGGKAAGAGSAGPRGPACACGPAGPRAGTRARGQAAVQHQEQLTSRAHARTHVRA